MKLEALHRTNQNSVDTKKLFSGTGQAISIHLLKDGVFKKHTTAIPAVLVCISGQAVFSYEHGKEIALSPGVYVEVELNEIHWITAKAETQLILLK